MLAARAWSDASVACPGASGFEDYRSGLHEAGFGEMEIVETGADLNAYAKVEAQSGCSCCGPALPVVDVATAGCCSPAPAAEDTAFHTRMSDLCARYDFDEAVSPLDHVGVSGGGSESRAGAVLAFVLMPTLASPRQVGRWAPAIGSLRGRRETSFGAPAPSSSTFLHFRISLVARTFTAHRGGRFPAVS